MITECAFVDSAKSFATEASKHLSILDGNSQRHIYYVDAAFIESYRSKQRVPCAIKGSMKIHTITVPKIGTLKHRADSCFCVSCRANKICPFGVDSGKSTVLFEGS